MQEYVYGRWSVTKDNGVKCKSLSDVTKINSCKTIKRGTMGQSRDSYGKVFTHLDRAEISSNKVLVGKGNRRHSAIANNRNHTVAKQSAFENFPNKDYSSIKLLWR